MGRFFMAEARRGSMSFKGCACAGATAAEDVRRIGKKFPKISEDDIKKSKNQRYASKKVSRLLNRNAERPEAYVADGPVLGSS